MNELNDLMSEQRELQLALSGSDPRSRTPDEQMNYVREMVLAATDELHEALAETGWKTWAASSHVHRDAFIGELVDSLQFVFNLLSLAGANGDEVIARMRAKHLVNWQRLRDGTNGLNKCPSCKRALDDAATRCTIDVCADAA